MAMPADHATAPIWRTCQACQRPFAISTGEQAFFAQLNRQNPAGDDGRGWRLPANCTECRAARRNAQLAIPSDTELAFYDIVCEDCQNSFRFGPRDVHYYIEHAFSWPKRCRPCREARRQFNARG